ncbi:linear amide C-N hydrolase [Enterococcus faecium]|uniref:linear amide C-N hydrolase n=1 Tax=Enterococcus faecium TaxID=1352 RepID=UPI0002A2DA80|nr:choloylglycine hydrolase family protein [Enterococcus faecium]ELA94217.1 hypothetical protein OIA_05112 [Enterococcus faecium EnGen0018]
MNQKVQRYLEEMNAGCSGLSWESEDKKHFWGRNFDFNRIASDSKITFIPSGTPFYTCGTAIENNLNQDTKTISKFAVIGIGSLILKSTPTFFEGMNEKGLMGGQLYYRKLAKYQDQVTKGTLPLQPIFVVTYLLSTCATIEEIVHKLNHEVTLVNQPVLENLPTVHWMFTDKTGESIVVESDKNGLHIYRQTMGILTNSPTYNWHCTNLLNYSNIHNEDSTGIRLNNIKLDTSFSGNGAFGLPGDFSSPSRFIRLAFLKNYSPRGKDEIEAITYMLHLLKNVQFPMGIVDVGEDNTITTYDDKVNPFDYTIYTAVMCAESLHFYWTTYYNMRIQCVDMKKLLNQHKFVQFELHSKNDICFRN